jgi:hypothetical protein
MKSSSVLKQVVLMEAVVLRGLIKKNKAKDAVICCGFSRTVMNIRVFSLADRLLPSLSKFLCK